MKYWMDIVWNHLPDFLSALIFLIIAWLIIGRLVKLMDFAMTHRALNATLSSFVKSFVGIALKTVVLITAAGIAGFEVTSLVTLMGAAGLAIGLSLQGELQNFAGGVMLLFFKPFEMGDYITVGQHAGKVEDIQIFNTKLRTADAHEVILPNKMLSNEVITNYTKSDQVIVHISLNIPRDRFNWIEVYNECSLIVGKLNESGICLNSNCELRIAKKDSEMVSLILNLKTTRSNVDDLKHQFWMSFKG
jgi:small conductance mechanosensitive channel